MSQPTNIDIMQRAYAVLAYAQREPAEAAPVARHHRIQPAPHETRQQRRARERREAKLNRK